MLHVTESWYTVNVENVFAEFRVPSRNSLTRIEPCRLEALRLSSCESRRTPNDGARPPPSSRLLAEELAGAPEVGPIPTAMMPSLEDAANFASRTCRIIIGMRYTGWSN